MQPNNNIDKSPVWYHATPCARRDFF